MDRLEISPDHPRGANWLFSMIVSLALVYVLVQAIIEFSRAISAMQEASVNLVVDGRVAWIGLVSLSLFLFLGSMAILWFPEKTGPIQQAVITWRERLGWFRWPIAMGIAVAVVYLHLYAPIGNALTGGYVRLVSILITGLLVAVLTTPGETQLLTTSNVFFGFVLAGGFFYVGQHFVRVSDYPFSLFWSEGNRLYDYSLYLGKDRYTILNELTISTSESRGRYLLWGILFLLPDSSIWMHRFWDAFLWTVPYFLLGYLLARWTELSTLNKWAFALWITLFLAQGPIYTPLILSALIVVVMVRPNRYLLSLIGAAIAGYYAAVSRWTWLLAPTAWAVLILISEYKLQKDAPWYKNLLRLFPIGIVAAAGLAGGALANARLFSPQQIASSTSLSQPLLWHRLLPNATYPAGILLGLAIAVGPLIMLMLWLLISRRWQLNWLQILAYTGACLVFVSIGLVASIKIGGGDNLHNLDMLFVTLAILSGLLLRGRVACSIQNWPIYARGLLALVVLLPVWGTVSQGGPLQLPPANEVAEALFKIDKQVDMALELGEVLFIDQRQLLTFGYIEGVPLVSDYEKKYMTDQAMAGNREYFERFYRDLANKRFSLILTDPLYPEEKGGGQSFGVENDAWVKWVAQPVLCYYEPIRKLRSVNVQLLVPRDQPANNCPKMAIIE